MPARIADIKSRARLNEREIADALAVSSQTLWRWKRGSAPPTDQREKLLDLHWITERLSTVFEPEDVNLWLYERHPRLGNQRPVDLIRRGEVEPVVELVDQLSTGAYI
ncbi:MAG: DUF2384 domain-containing protein [Actinomycetota bacterium]|nr:DUF2384 domain-containing protein [Actinomycetota bacterium]